MASGFAASNSGEDAVSKHCSETGLEEGGICSVLFRGNYTFSESTELVSSL